MELSEQELHNIGHMQYQVDQASDEKPECGFDYTLVRTVLKTIERLRHEVHELRRTRSEAEANARVEGYREGAAGIVSQLRALSITVNTEPPSKVTGA